MKAILSKPKRELTVNFPVRMDDGIFRVFTGYRVQHSLTRGPGERRHSLPSGRDAGRSKSARHVDDLEMRHCGYSLRRGKGGIIVDPKHSAWPSSSGMTRRFAAEISPIIGPESRHPCARREHQLPDDGLDHGHHLHDAGYPMPGLITGKPIAIEGSLGRNEATARGLQYVVREAVKTKGMSLRALV